jgi:hypothetical protein
VDLVHRQEGAEAVQLGLWENRMLPVHVVAGAEVSKVAELLIPDPSPR